MNDTNGYFEKFTQERERLLSLLRSGMDIFTELELPSDRTTLEKAGQRLASGKFKVLVLGEFKRGKSTFINALLGEVVLPAFSIPCTAVINEIKWDDNKHAILHFTETLPTHMPDTIADEVAKHITKNKGKNVPPIQIPVGDIENYVVIQDPGKDQAEAVAESPFSLVEIFWPLDLCRNGVEIIDSPGLNEHGTRTRVTTEYLGKVDAVLFVLSCQALASQSEIQMIDQNIRGSGHEEVFFICNRFDEVLPNERDRIIKYGQLKLKEKTTFAEHGIYFISALNALDGRLNADTKKIEQSGIIPLEKHLSFFLVHERGRIKLMQPARDLNRLLNKVAFDYIPTQRKMLDASLSDLEKRCTEVTPRLIDAEHKRDQIKEKIQNSRQRLKRDVEKQTSIFIKDIADSIPEWLVKYGPKAQIKLLSMSHKAQANVLIKELCDFVASRIETEQAKWQKETLQPAMQVQMEELGEGVRDNIAEFISTIDDIKGYLVKKDPSEERELAPFERILAAAGGFLAGGVGSSLVGSMFGYKEMMKSLLPNMALAFGMIIVGLTNPFILIAALLTAGSIQGLFKVNAMMKEIKIKVGQELSSRLRASVADTSKKTGDAIFARTESILLNIDAGLQKEIQGIKESVDSVLAAKRSGEENVKRRVKQLDNILASAQSVQSQLDDMIFAIEGKA